MTVLLLTGFLATILMRVLKNDFIKYTREDDAIDEQVRGAPFTRSGALARCWTRGKREGTRSCRDRAARLRGTAERRGAGRDGRCSAAC